LNVGGHYNEDSAYNTYELYGKECYDNFWIFKSELCYENINCERCYKTFFSQNCFDCVDTILCYDCKACQNIFGCAGLRHKQYYIFNKPVSKEEYYKFLKENSISSYKNLQRLKEKANKIWLSVPHQATLIFKSVNSEGNFITNSKNAKNCWTVDGIENSKNIFIGAWIKDSYDLSCFGWGELLYEGAHSVGLYNSKFFMFTMGGGEAKIMQSFNLEYCYGVQSSHDCFGCVNLKNKEYCILNKRYSKKDYQTLVSKIRKHMEKMPYIDKKGRIYKYGESFPIELSPFGYNETAAQDYYPLTRKEAIQEGYPWSDYESQIKYQFSDYQIPDDISEVKDDVLEKILKCEVTGKAYKIIPQELNFYRKMGLPLPKRCPLWRHRDRLAQLPKRKLFLRKCQKCEREIQTVYSPERPEIVYCEKCYLAEIV
jgi:hypothetical protein